MKAKIIHILCEGQTEQGFVEDVLSPYLREHGITGVKSILLTTNKKKNARGGMISFNKVLSDLSILQQTNKDGVYERHIFTTMFDLYALPSDFPGFEQGKSINDPYLKVAHLEKAFANEIKGDHFIPYIQLHEFEALLFCGIDFIIKLYPDCDKRCEQLNKALLEAGNPELIDNSPETAPSKRIIEAIEGNKKTHYNYNKPKTGKAVTKNIGIEQLRSKCKHFDEWIEKLISC